MGVSEDFLSGVSNTSNTPDGSFITFTNSPNTTVNITNSTNSLQHTDDQDFSRIMNIYLVISAFIVVCGLLGNVFTIIIMRKEPFRLSSYGFHLTALAVADMLCLIMFTLVKESTIYLFEKDVLADSLIVCKMFFCVFAGARIFASSNVVYICVERFIAVWFPFKAQYLLTKRPAIIITGCMLVAANLVGIANYLEAVVKSGKCLIYDETIPIALTIVSLLYLIVPTVSLLSLTPLIIFKLVRTQLLKRRMTNNSGNDNEQLAYMTAMLIGILIAYIVFVIFPVAARLVISNIGIILVESKSRGLSEVFLILEQLNCSINFIIYGLLCSAFRNQFIAFCRIPCKLRADITRSDWISVNRPISVRSRKFTTQILAIEKRRNTETTNNEMFPQSP